MSEVWNHFYMAPNGLSVNCNHCGKFMKRSDSSTKSMWGHLKAFHSELVGEETFRLKRTRRMRGENNNKNNNKEAKNKKKRAKIENLGKNTQRQKSNSSVSSNSSSNFLSENSSSSGEENDEENNKNEGEREVLKENNNEGEKQLKKEEENNKVFNGNSSALSIHSLLKLDAENESKIEPPQNHLNSPQPQNQQFPNQTLQFGLDNILIPTTFVSSTSPTFQLQKTSSINLNNCKTFAKHSTNVFLQKQQQQNKEGKRSPAHGSEAPLPNFNNQKLSEAKQELHQFSEQNSLTNLQHFDPLMGLNEQQQILALANDPNLLVRLETAAIMTHLVQLQQQQQFEKSVNLPQNELKEEKQPIDIRSSEAFQQQNGHLARTSNLFPNYQPNVNCLTPQQQQQQVSALASWLCSLEWMAALQKQSTPLNTQIPLQQFLPAQTQQQIKKETSSESNKASINAKNQKRKSGLISATLLTTPSTTPSTFANSLQVLAETATCKNLQTVPKDQSTPPLPYKTQTQRKSPQIPSIDEQISESLTESLILYGMHRIAMDLQLSYSVQANKQGKAEYAFYKNAGGVSTIQSMITLTESTDQKMLNIREYLNGTIISEEFWPKNLEPCSLLNSLKEKCQRGLCN